MIISEEYLFSIFIKQMFFISVSTLLSFTNKVYHFLNYNQLIIVFINN
jgi:hypothetical protein